MRPLPRHDTSFCRKCSSKFHPLLSLLLAALASVSSSVQAATYSGNGNAGFGGPIGSGTLTLSDDGTTITGTINKGNGSFNDVLVLYIDSVSGGFSDTSGFADNTDGLRKAISGFDGGSNRSTLTFASGFLPDFAVALGPGSDNFGGLWQLASGSSNSLIFKTSVNLSPVGNASASSYTFSFKFSDIGLASGQKFMLLGTYVSNTGFRSGEAIAGDDRGAQGWNSFTQVTNAVYGMPESATVPQQVPAFQPTRSAGADSSAPEAKQLCWKNLLRIDAAIRAYRAQKKEVPNWLSDLVPEFLDDANILICPVTKRTGQIQNFGLTDPKLATSYIYEFCNEPVPQNISGGSHHTMREWKRRQMELVGDIVPLVRCHLHAPLLNLSFGGKVYESPATWEEMVTNQVNAADLSVASLFSKDAATPGTDGSVEKQPVSAKGVQH